MLELKNISKSYTTGDFTQNALNDVSIAFRDSEFAAILGPSGSGKTTMLNIIGGLDKYDSGDLIIDGISTKNYTDKDWDTFRNNRVGFIFQSYNLIPHQSVLANVELALTLSGVDREERRKRAIEALERVGLGDHINKKPNQLSGGQAQRVAIARALINDPEIVLADEPTGALDSKTSVEIMDLLTDIAKDHLVVMVTHNPELAQQYATRIVTLADGEIRNDSDAFFPTEEDERNSQKVIRPAKMSLLTAISLSFNNLMTKKSRTILTAFAGSIGIIGIAAILALANGVNNYIKSIEEDTLTVYPLMINSTGFDMTSMMSLNMGQLGDDSSSSDDDSSDDAAKNESAEQDASDSSDASDESTSNGKLREIPMIERMFSSIDNNDLASLKKYLDGPDSHIYDYARSIDYEYNVVPQIFAADTSDGVRQINPDMSFSSLGFNGTSSSLMSQFMSTDIFGHMPSDTSIIEDQYDLVAGKWPTEYNECIAILGPTGGFPDFYSYVLGMRDYDELTEMINQLADDQEITVVTEDIDFTLDDILNVQMKLVNEADYYQYDADYGVWVDKSDNEDYMRSIIDESPEIKIVGVLQPAEGVSITALSAGIYYLPELTTQLIDNASKTDIVKEQLANPDIDVFNGVSFVDEQNGENSDAFDMSSMFTIDESALQNAFNFDSSKLTFDASSLDMSMNPADMPPMPVVDFSDLQLSQDPDIDYAKLGPIIAHAQTLPTREEQNAYIAEHLPEAISNYQELTTEAQMLVQMRIQQTMGAYMQKVIGQLTTKMSESLKKSMSNMTSGLADAMHIDPSAFANAFQVNIDEDEISELIMSLMTSTEASFDKNLANLGYADLAKPSEIKIYPIDFESKQEIISILDKYNDQMEADGEEDKQISYTDIVGTLMKSVTTIIDMISAMLIAFVSISLIVSSIMIAIITYISVLERRKEIGILRAVGASKKDVSRIFNAETVMEGFASGVLGVGITALGCIPASIIVYNLLGVPNIASLPIIAALILILISVALSFIAGIIPASSASRHDPVEALRSE